MYLIAGHLIFTVIVDIMPFGRHHIKETSRNFRYPDKWPFYKRKVLLEYFL